MSTENGVTRSLIMLKSFPCNAQSVRASSSSITLTRMSDNRETSTRNDNDPSPTSDTEGRRTSRRGSVRRNEYEDDFRNILPLNIEYQTSSTTSGSLSEPREHIRIRFQPFEDAVPNPMPLPPTLSSSSNVDFSFSPYRIEAADANVQVGGGISASMDELDPVDSHLRMSSHPARDIHSAYAHQFPTLSVDPYARAPHTNIPPPPPDTFFPSDSWWSYEYIHHEGYPGPHMTSIRPGFAVEPQMPGPTPASSGNNEETVDERTEKKPAATPGRRKKKGQGTGSSEKQAPRKKTTPRKIRSRAQRSSNGSSSSSSPSAGSPGAKKGDAEANELVGPDPDEIQQATTDRARQALKSWHQRLNDLVRFREIHGHSTFNLHICQKPLKTLTLLSSIFAANVPQKYSENPELGVWVNKQRMEKKAFDDEKKSSMTDKKISKLEQAGFKW